MIDRELAAAYRDRAPRICLEDKAYHVSLLADSTDSKN